MKITKVKAILLRNELSSSMQISRGGFSVRYHTLVLVETDAGVTGLGEGVGNAHLVKALIEGQLGDMAIGMDPMNTEVLRNKLIDSQVYFERQGSAICAASAIEMACWDIKGKVLDLPVSTLLGGLVKDKIEAYASDVYWEESPDDMARNAERIVELGFKTIKAHIGHGSPKEDEIRVQALRNALGDDIGLIVDLNCGYDFLTAQEAIKRWEEYDLKWIEELLNPNHVGALAELRKKSSIPIAAGENVFQIHGFKDLFEENAIDIAMPDIGRVGGIQETRNVCVLADAYGIPVSPHNYSSGVLLASTIHVMASTKNTFLLEIDTSKNAIINELLVEPMKFENGMISSLDLPGLGVELTQEVIDKFAV
ncbi:MAG: mandelate racemase/muconate lactonizing enzyme family protein [Bacteroidetes bacterium]|jgi:D-galactarolactone cycloisomerase|nr:mandelate racemase/muconate lactonizing enzyme family protein [Bacteroidota bacterium]